MISIEEQIKWINEQLDNIDTAMAHFDGDEEWKKQSIASWKSLYAISESLNRLKDLEK